MKSVIRKLHKYNDFFFKLHPNSAFRRVGRRKPSVKARRCPLSEFWRHCVLCSETLPFTSTPERRNENILFPRLGMESTTCHVYSHTLVPLRHDCSLSYIVLSKHHCNKILTVFHFTKHNLRQFLWNNLFITLSQKLPALLCRL